MQQKERLEDGQYLLGLNYFLFYVHFQVQLPSLQLWLQSGQVVNFSYPALLKSN